MRCTYPLALAAALPIALAAAPALADTTVVHAGNVIADADSQPTGPATITVTDGRIVSIESGWNPAPAGAETVRLEGMTVVPGLIDLHVHLTGDPGGDFWKDAVEPEEWGVVVGAKNAAKNTAVSAVKNTAGKAGKVAGKAFEARVQ